ncbi:hypothetical protein IQ215_11220 [Cyanobacterium stanieri LEGE 03274]|uniref:Cell division protein FtsL n=1 Tax=Cyanobacterium stanieri LEGE 03274 TaxID=1828756 RepID=A0ABR9V5X4_9CHRO|nr:hypothetical protein [Cyanobacterium stanieri]MBE9223267.1 hypothetical protein [Cyanobacterium stanieri LEGE 03274]
MLAPDRPSPRQQLSTVPRKNPLGHQKTQVSARRNNIASGQRFKNRPKSVVNPVVLTPQKVTIPFWLKCFNFITHTSTGLSIATVVGCFVVYAITVSAPKEWTKRYRNLQDLQKRERQLTFNDEVLKNQLAQEAREANSGLVSPDLSQPPIFLPKVDVDTLEKEQTPTSSPKKIEPIFPIAY